MTDPMVAGATAVAAPGRPTSRRRIEEIDGLRGIALSLVVAYHLFGQGRVSGGVDVFLFVSGVVLTLSLVRGVADGRPGAVFARWGRTFARLTPPAALVLTAVVGLAFTVLPPWNRDQTLVEVASAAVFLENWQLIASQLAYGAAGPETSPVQHFWSLSIQGQLLIAIPIVVAVAFAIPAVRAVAPRLLWALAIGATAASFVYAVVLHASDPAVAYFDTFARFWELGAGLLVGGALALGLALPAATQAVAGWAGLGVIVASGLLFDGATAYPGPAALVPVGGAVLVVLSAQGRGGPGALLRSRPLARLARVSYALFLWHWPVLIAYLAVTGNVEGVVGGGGAAIVLAISLALAIATERLLERPLARALARAGTVRRLLTALVAILLVVAVSMGGLLVGRSASADPGAAPSGVVSCSAEDSGTAACDPDVDLPCLGAAALDPERPECADAADPDVAPIPAYDDLRTDDDNRQECWASKDEDAVMCTVGPETGYSAHLLAVGDSHNNTLLGVYEQIALRNDWRIDVAGRPACHWTHATRTQNSERLYEGCEYWKGYVEDYIDATPLDGVIVTNSSRAGYDVPAGEDLETVRAEGFAEAWATRADPDLPIIAIRDNPIFPVGSIGCILDLGRVAAGDCSLPRSEALVEDGLAAGVALSSNAHLVDLTDYMCDPDRCGLVVGGVVVSRDGSHLTASFARTLTPYLERAIRDVLGG